MIIKSKKELYEFLPAELQAPKTKQNIGKIFSIAASNYWTVDYDNSVLTFTFDNQYITVQGSVYLRPVISPIKGQWISQNGELFKERMIPVRIACSREQIDKIADITAKYYDQKAIMYYLISEEVTIKNYE